MEDFPLTPAKASAGRLAALAATLNQNHPASAKDLANAQRCLTWGVPNLVPSSTMSHYQILQTPDYVVHFRVVQGILTSARAEEKPRW